MSYGQFDTRGNYGLVRSYSRTLGRAIVLAVPRNIYEQKNPAAQFITHRLSGAERTARVLAGLGDTTQSTLSTTAAIPAPAPVRMPTPPLRFAPISTRASGVPVVDSGSQICPAWGCGTPPWWTGPVSGTPVSAPAAPPASNQPSISAAPVSYPPSSAQAAYPGETWTDPATGNVWAWNGSSWSFIQTGATTQMSPVPSTVATTPPPTNIALQSTGGGATAQAGTNVPVGWPTNQPYTDSAGNIWTYTATGGWQITGTSSGAAGTDWLSELTAWLQESTLVSGIQNFWIAAGVGAGGLVLYGLANSRRR